MKKEQKFRIIECQVFPFSILEKKVDTIPISTKVTDEDLENAITIDGAKYSRDKKRLLEGVDINTFHILPGTEVICDSAFENCDNLQQITIPNSVTHIGDCAFKHCDNLQQITIPNSVTHIGDDAFSECYDLHQITIPNSVTQIGTNPFAGCYHIRLECHSNHFIIDGKALFNKERNRIISCMSNDSTFTIPNSVTHIGDDAFWGCENLQQITIPNSVTHIGNAAFNGCGSLQQITIPNSVTNIGDEAFESCDNLQQITIPNSVTHIGDDAFLGCETLQEITIPNSVTHIGYGAFSWCKKLQQITIPNSVTNIGDYAFLGCEKLQQITIPNSVTHIGDFAFSRCKNLQQITIPNSVTHIGENPFVECYHIRLECRSDHFINEWEALFNKERNRIISCMSNNSTFTIPNSVTHIGNSAFWGCENLQQITIPCGARAKFEKLLPSSYHQLLKEMD